MSAIRNAFRGTQSGVSLIELMVAVTIGLILIAGALAVFIDSRATSRVNQIIARAQENGLFAADEVSRSLELAGYWGENNNTALVEGRTKRTAGAVSTASTLAAATSNCTAADGYQWYTDLHRPIEGLDATGTASANTASSYSTCIPNATYQAGTDILIVRYVDPAPIDPDGNALTEPDNVLVADTVYMRSDPKASRLFIGTTAPAGFDATANNYRVRAYAYYVSSFYETAGDGIPALKRASLDTGSGGSPRIIPGNTNPIEEDIVIPGVENFQIQFGIDTTGDGSANRYLNAGTVAAAQWNDVVAVRFWLIVRADVTEQFYTNAQTYRLPQSNFVPNDNFRRVRITRTVQVRNIERT